jgi:tetratricopeptide (TPR) repeat protein
MLKTCLLCAAVVVALATTAPAALAQEPADPTDLGTYQRLVDEGLFPTVENVATAKRAAEAAVVAGNCSDAIPLLDAYIRMANWHSNLLFQGLRPFYSASNSAQTEFFRSQSQSERDRLIRHEQLVNDYRQDRNHAYVLKAECLVELDRPSEALATYAQALDLIGVEDGLWWNRAAQGLYTLLGAGW